VAATCGGMFRFAQEGAARVRRRRSQSGVSAESADPRLRRAGRAFAPALWQGSDARHGCRASRTGRARVLGELALSAALRDEQRSPETSAFIHATERCEPLRPSTRFPSHGNGRPARMPSSPGLAEPPRTDARQARRKCRSAREAARGQAGRSAAAKRSMIAAAGSTLSIVPTLWPAYSAIASTSPLLADSGMLSA
jgi:hypothetical protein